MNMIVISADGRRLGSPFARIALTVQSTKLQISFTLLPKTHRRMKLKSDNDENSVCELAWRVLRRVCVPVPVCRCTTNYKNGSDATYTR